MIGTAPRATPRGRSWPCSTLLLLGGHSLARKVTGRVVHGLAPNLQLLQVVKLRCRPDQSRLVVLLGHILSRVLAQQRGRFKFLGGTRHTTHESLLDSMQAQDALPLLDIVVLVLEPLNSSEFQGPIHHKFSKLDQDRLTTQDGAVILHFSIREEIRKCATDTIQRHLLEGSRLTMSPLVATVGIQFIDRIFGITLLLFFCHFQKRSLVQGPKMPEPHLTRWLIEVKLHLLSIIARDKIFEHYFVVKPHITKKGTLIARRTRFVIRVQQLAKTYDLLLLRLLRAAFKKTCSGYRQGQGSNNPCLHISQTPNEYPIGP
mmetsp:Transcript_28276/g.60256  ORF Transcript_28276/g.60256 Transcript_28276/m.60256 type:complete len:317 (-) Transcript_28276:1032-1982(-)